MRFNLFLVLVLCGSIVDAWASTRIPRPDCWDYHGCGVFEMTDSEYRDYWRKWGMSPPTDLRNGQFGTEYLYPDGVYRANVSGQLVKIKDLPRGWGLDVNFCEIDFKIVTVKCKGYNDSGEPEGTCIEGSFGPLKGGCDEGGDDGWWQ